MYTQSRYKLSPTQEIVIGRNPECEIFLDSGLYSKVSWSHAKVQLLSKPDAGRTALIWQICDLNSTNGTYVNGKRLQGCQALDSGVRIALASPSTGRANPEFIFEYQPTASTVEDDSLYKQVVDCDVLFLVIDASQPLSTNEK